MPRSRPACALGEPAVCAGGEGVLVSMIGVNGRGALRFASYAMPPWVCLSAAALSGPQDLVQPLDDLRHFLRRDPPELAPYAVYRQRADLADLDPRGLGNPRGAQPKRQG